MLIAFHYLTTNVDNIGHTVAKNTYIHTYIRIYLTHEFMHIIAFVFSCITVSVTNNKSQSSEASKNV